MMNIIVIGNRLMAFSNNHNIVTFDQLMYWLAIEAKLPSSKNQYQVCAGQGLTDQQLTEINEKVAMYQLEKRFMLAGSLLAATRASSQLTHKHLAKNTMITMPERLGEHAFRSYLMLNEHCAEMSDHITGQHIQGMVLIEAARQMVNAVSEAYLIGDEVKARKGFVLNQIDSRFLAYVFPLDVQLRFHVKQMRKGLGGNFKATAEIDIVQNDQVMMQVNIGFSVMDKQSLLNIESKMACESVKAVLTQGLPSTATPVAA